MEVTRRFGKISTGLGALALMMTLMMALASPAQAQAYSFTKVADSTADDFEPFSFGCATINARGDIAFKAGRLAPDGFNTIPGIYRVNADGSLTTIAEDAKRFATLGFNPSMNDLGEVSFAARIDGGKKPDTESILRGGGKKLTTIASTADEFNFFGFDTSISNSGEVAFKAELDEEFNFEEGLFSGSGRAITTHYLASTSDFDGNDPARRSTILAGSASTSRSTSIPASSPDGKGSSRRSRRPTRTSSSTVRCSTTRGPRRSTGPSSTRPPSSSSRRSQPATAGP